MDSPRTLQEAIVYYDNPDHALEFVASLRWPDGVACPRCDSKRVSFLKTRRIWKCMGCRKQFSVKVGTIMEDSPIPLSKWLAAIWLITNTKNGTSSCEIARDLHVTQKTAWFLDHRIRLMMHTGSFEKKLCGEVEVDESFIGGKARFMHVAQRQRRITGTGGKDKVAVMGILERNGEVRTMVVENRRKKVLQAEVKKHVEAGSALYSDALLSYEGLAGEYAHKVVDHAVAYVNGQVHTNGLENFWSLLKRGLRGTYVSVEPFHLFRYLDEQAWRFNQRKLNDSERFQQVCARMVGRRLTYKDLIGLPAGGEA